MLNIEKIKELLQGEIDKGIKKNFLCSKIGIPTASFFNYLYANVKPDYESLDKIAAYFHKPIAYFFDETAEQMSDPDQLDDDECQVIDLTRKIRAKTGTVKFVLMALTLHLETIEETLGMGNASLVTSHQSGVSDGRARTALHEAPISTQPRRGKRTGSGNG